jgi:hypothetical protein
MPELGPYGSVRGARGNSRPYRESGWPTVKVPRMTRLRLWPQEEPTVTSTDGRHLAVFFLP